MHNDIIKILQEYLSSEEIDEETQLLSEYNLDEDDLINIADIITENTGIIIGADDIERCKTVEDICNICTNL